MPSLNEAHLRHARHYEGVAVDADRLFLQGGTQFKRGRRMFDLAWPQIHSAFTWAETHSSVDLEAARLCSDFLTAAPYCLDFRLTPHERITWLEAALSGTRHLGDRAAEGKHLGDLGVCYHTIGEYQSAAKFHRERLTITRELGDRRGESVALNNLGNTYHSLAHLENPYVQFTQASSFFNSYLWRAIECHRQAFIITRELGDRLGECSTWRFLARAYIRLGLYQRARKYLEQALRLAREIDSYLEQSMILVNLGNVHKYMGNYPRSIYYYEQALVIQEEINNPSDKLGILGSVGSAYLWRRNYTQAIKVYREKLTLARQLGDQTQEAAALSGLGATYMDKGDLPQAIGHYEEALMILEETSGNRTEQATLKSSVGHVYLRLKNKQKASELFFSARAICQELDQPISIGLAFGIWFLSLPELFLPVIYSFFQLLSALFPLHGILAKWTIRPLANHLKTDNKLEKIADLSKKIDRYPMNAKYYSQRGRISYQLADYRYALEDFLHASQLDPRNPWHYADTAMAYEARQDYVRAVECYDQALRRKGSEARLWSNRGLAYCKIGNYAKALGDFSLAIRYNPKRARHYSHRGLTLYYLGKYEEAELDFAKAISLNVDNDVYADLAAVSAMKGNLNAAIENLRKAFELDREDTLRRLNIDHKFDSIRATHEFQSLVRELEN